MVLTDMLENCNGFDIMGHYDYICRYAPYDDPRMLYRDFPDLFDKIFSLLTAKNKALELNTATSSFFRKKGLADYMPDPEIFRQYAKAGGKYVTYGSDAHCVERLFDLYTEVLPFLKSLGFDQLTYYKDRKPVLYDIE